MDHSQASPLQHTAPTLLSQVNTGLFKVIVGVEYIVAPMDQEILKVFFYDVRCAVVMHFSRN